MSNSTEQFKPILSFESIFSFVGINSIFKKAGFIKRSGASVEDLFLTLVSSVFYGNKNLFRLFSSPIGKAKDFGKDSLYRMCANPKYNWQYLLFQLAVFAITFIHSLNKGSKDTVNCLVVDDTMIERSRGKKVELLSRQFNHVIGKTVKGFTNLSLGWADGISFIPVLNYLIASAKEKNQIMPDKTKGKSRKECGVDKRTNAGKLRNIAVKTKPDVLIDMVKKAVKLIPAQDILMDSWFFSDSLIKQLYDLGLNTICLVKSNLQFRTLDAPDTPLTQKQLLKKLCNGKLRNANTLTSAIVVTNQGSKVKVVLVKSYNSKDVIAIVSTDLSLSDEEIIRIYGFRWNIEVNFKIQKQYLGLKTECQCRDFNSCNTFMITANIRYLFIELNRRHDNDPRGHGEIFCTVKSEMLVIPFLKVLQHLLQLIDSIVDRLDEAGCLKSNCRDVAKQVISDLIEEWYAEVTDYVKQFFSLPSPT